MGCDIHLMVEHRVKRGDTEKDDVWETVAASKNKNSKDEEEQYGEWYSGRNYNLFGILADVRNGRGFAGVETGEGFVPILPEDAKTPITKGAKASPFCRGVPTNASGGYKKSVREMGIDGHSHSWFSLTELETYDWKAKNTTLYGVVGPSMYAAWKASDGKAAPPSYSGAVMGAGVKNVTNVEMDQLIADGTVKPKKIPAGADWVALSRLDDKDRATGKTYYTRVAWTETYAEAAGSFITSAIPRLQAYAAEHKIDHDDIRLCFYFDN